MFFKRVLLTLFTVACLSLFSQAQKLAAGPMLGYIEFREVAIWLQTHQSEEVFIRFWPINQLKDVKTTEIQKSLSSQAYCLTFKLGYLMPGTSYEYQIVFKNKVDKGQKTFQFTTQALWAWRKDAPDFSFALGSCAYINDSIYDRPGKPYGGEYEIFESIATKRPNFMLWGGDNTYLREADWTSKSGILYRYSHTRQLPEMQNLLSTCANYAIIDDHDFGSNDANRSFPKKQTTEEAFHLFWPNPVPIAEKGKGLYTQFTWGDADFFLLDDRTFRTPESRSNLKERSILGKEQLDWLMDQLASSRARFKFIVVGSQFLNPNSQGESFMAAEFERIQILDLIQTNKIKNVVFLTGDRHFTEMSKLSMEGGIDVFDLTCSPLTSGVAGGKHVQENNALRMTGSQILKRNFAILQLKGGKKERELRIQIFNSKGELEWEKVIPAKD